MVINIMSPWVKMPFSWNFIEKYRGKKIQKDSKMGTKKIHDTFTHHTIPHLVSEFFISDATWKKSGGMKLTTLLSYILIGIYCTQVRIPKKREKKTLKKNRNLLRKKLINPWTLTLTYINRSKPPFRRS